MDEHRLDPAPAPLAPLPWAEEQRLLGVGVRVQRRTRLHLRHLPALARAAEELQAGMHETLLPVVAARLEALRRRLWRAPGWRDRLRAAAASPDDLQRLDDIDRFAVLGRDEYARTWTSLLDADGDPELHLATTSGSTGQALPVPRSGYDGLHMWAVIRFWLRHLRIALPPRPRLVLLCALPGGLEYSVRAPHFDGGALHRLSALRPRLSERVRKARPAVLSSDPAGLQALLGSGTVPSPRLVLSSASELSPRLRQDAQAALGAPVVNYFAATETGPIAWECLREAGRFHVLHPDVWVESLGGELLVTRLRDSPLPLLRYRTGDRGEVVDTPCACGAGGRSIVGFRGRQPCTFVTPAGAEVDAWALSWLFKDLPLVRFEMAQVGPERFELRLSPPGPGAVLLVTRLRRVLARLGFPQPVVELSPAPPPAAAKPTPFVRRLPSL